MEKLNWWENRTPRSVDNLKLWVDNPRLDPVESHETLKDFVEDLISDQSERDEFIDLVKSISERGFTSFDPIVVWKDDRGRFVVAEGNRRVLALKLLRRPENAPKEIRKFIREQSKRIDRDEIEKIRVCVAPSYKETRWYILQRHSTGSLLKRWQRLQQQRFILNAYEEQGQDVEATAEVTGLKRGEIMEALRYVCLRNIATRIEITSLLTQEEKDAVYSHKISMTILERWFGKKLVREKWGVEFDGMDVVIHSNVDSFYKAYGKFLKLMLSPIDNELGFSINTRTIDGRFDEIFKALPEVTFSDDTPSTTVKPEKFDPEKERKAKEQSDSLKNTSNSNNGKAERGDESNAEPKTKKILKANPDRNQMVSPYQTVNVSSYKLKALFKEFQVLPVKKYRNISTASLRVFLDLSVDEFFKANHLENELAKQESKGYHEVTLQKRLQFIANAHIKSKHANKVIKELLTPSNEFSLNTLNDYVHGTQTHKTHHRFINGFWDMLSPLLSDLIDLKEK
ncbi:hypothetical protein BZG72_02230 [Salinivibrio sp. PR6]|uniref:ParB N-terminal domain-containing protein n=1 Tax=Salinivibrio sp. PR6 TaxID=1909485 RepID=UPI0009D1C018|nr:ParB N-terminal domain-containing protein [Salinivibrio sp. PR6]OOE84755.1 hypothetical protein BZG72_02230 [Salinivibrio sp. PR6]